jgi:hypothetical protein
MVMLTENTMQTTQSITPDNGYLISIKAPAGTRWRFGARTLATYSRRLLPWNATALARQFNYAACDVKTRAAIKGGNLN